MASAGPKFKKNHPMVQRQVARALKEIEAAAPTLTAHFFRAAMQTQPVSTDYLDSWIEERVGKASTSYFKRRLRELGVRGKYVPH